MAEKIVSVIMSNYNTPEIYLRSAIDSILDQSYRNLEFIIVDDCSTDDSVRIIECYLQKDNRVKLIKNEVNLGITKSLNRAIKEAHGEYIARMDADDISERKRIEKQVNYMEQHTNVVVCGTWVRLFGEAADQYAEKEVKKIIPPKEEFRINLLFGNHINIIHPTAMFRRDMLEHYHIEYNENYKYAQDYRMWVECSKFGECVNVPEILFNYRVHNKAISTDKKKEQEDCARRIIEEQLSWLQLTIPQDWQALHYGFLIGRKQYSEEQYLWIKTIVDNNKRFQVYEQKTLESVLWKKWAEIVYFEVAQNKRRLSAIYKLPLEYYPELVRIYRTRNEKKHIR